MDFSIFGRIAVRFSARAGRMCRRGHQYPDTGVFNPSEPKRDFSKPEPFKQSYI